MTHRFNSEFVKQFLQVEDKFISKMFSRMPLSTDELEEQGKGDDEGGQQQNNKAKSFNSNGNPKRALTSEELYQKFNELKGQKKLSYKQKHLKKGLKNRIRKRSKREERVMHKNLIRSELNADGVQLNDREEVEVAPRVPRAKPVFNSNGHMVFSKFDFSDIGNKKKAQKTESHPKKVLGQLKEKKERLKDLVTSGEMEKAMVLQERDAWKAALAKANGEKVKDDPELLKRTIKRDEQQKKRSSKKWESRIFRIGKAQQEKQRKRTENIMKKKKDKKTNKMKKASKKGRIIPGF
ncbi:surfeit locus protein 6 homolog [Diachasma alloeum]|uniref:surfeit locus protein 6 homolog n=1 Tax=Diachasma alloeum TaxID=454923 RepID=UPI00073820AB|nr:surfeit locus protein 6 homolog [Diachasma alloeum]